MKFLETAGGCVTVVILFVVLVIGGVGCFVWNWGAGIYHQTATPERAVERYEWYEQQVRDIKAVDGQVRDAQGAVDRFKADNGPSNRWKFDQREEYARLNTNLQGLKSYRRGLVEDYNARAGMISRNLWKRPDLPTHIEE